VSIVFSTTGQDFSKLQIFLLDQVVLSFQRRISSSHAIFLEECTGQTAEKGFCRHYFEWSVYVKNEVLSDITSKKPCKFTLLY
jgi:hypothetical protein